MTAQGAAPGRRHRGGAVHPEGRTLLLATGAVLISATLVAQKRLGSAAGRALAAASVTILAFLAQFFRYPACTTPGDIDLVVAPASGRVVHIGLDHEPELLGDSRLRISVFLSVFDAHLTRSPITGSIIAQRYRPGRYLVALHPKSSTLNERNSILLEHPGGQRVLLRQIAGFLARRIRSYVAVGESVVAGEEVGYITLGSRVDLFLPATTTALAHVGQTVRAGETPLARLTAGDE